MEVCNDGHEEIIFESRWCPLCTKQEEMEKLQKDLDITSEELAALEQQHSELQDLVKEYNPELLV